MHGCDLPNKKISLIKSFGLSSGSLSFGLLLAGCATPIPAPPPQELPVAFDAGPLNGAIDAGLSTDWYRNFGSDDLDLMVEMAQQNNGDVAVARTRVTQADARARQAGAAVLPSVDATGNANFLAGLSASRSNGRVRVSIIDNGPGILENMRGKVLQRFFRLEVSRTTAGNGLGLSLANAIVDAHGATLELADAAPGVRTLGTPAKPPRTAPDATTASRTRALSNANHSSR